MPATSTSEQSSKPEPLGEEASDGARPPRAARRWPGISGADSATNGRLRRVFRYSLAITAVAAASVGAQNVITWLHDKPASNIAVPIVAEATGWLTLVLFFWVPWLAWLAAPPAVRPRLKLLIHVPAALLFAFCHVGGFFLLRWVASRIAGYHGASDPFVTQFLYEARKDALTYLLIVAGLTLVDRVLRAAAPAVAPAPRTTFDIRDGAKLARVRLHDILAIASAGNYVEFYLDDGRRLLMRSSLSALESELAPLGFLRTHRSWLVNLKRVTALKPAGSGDYAVEVGTMTAPLSRRYPLALAKLRGAGA